MWPKWWLSVQVELLLTLEEYCAAEGNFQRSGQGKAFADVFAEVQHHSPALWFTLSSVFTYLTCWNLVYCCCPAL